MFKMKSRFNHRNLGYLFKSSYPLIRASLVAQWNPPAMQESQEVRVQSLGWEDPWRRKWQPTPVLLPGESHSQRNLAGYSPWGHKELDMTELCTDKRITAHPSTVHSSGSTLNGISSVKPFFSSA